MQTVTQILREAEKAGTDGQAEGGGSDSEEWNGLDDDVPEAPMDIEEEYIDEDRYTTVTVEVVSVDRDGLHKPGPDSGEGTDGESAAKDAKQQEDTDKGSKKKEWPKKKKKSFRYETKFERKIAERKQKAKKGRR